MRTFLFINTSRPFAKRFFGVTTPTPRVRVVVIGMVLVMLGYPPSLVSLSVPVPVPVPVPNVNVNVNNPPVSLPRVSFVTGASGYVGREIVHALLEETDHRRAASTTTNNEEVTGDVNVNVTVPSDVVVCLVRPSKVSRERRYWERQQEKQRQKQQQQQEENKQTNSVSPQIYVRPYDMLDGGRSFQEALECVCSHNNDNDNDDKERDVVVFHVASIFGPTRNHTETALQNVAGTEALVHTLAKYNDSRRGSRRGRGRDHCRLILTSSMAAVRGPGQAPQHHPSHYTHKDWNTVSQLQRNDDDPSLWGQNYQWSKATSERRAWELCRHYGIPMTALCPSFVFGPLRPVDVDSDDDDDESLGGSSSSSSSSWSQSQSFSVALVTRWVTGDAPVQSRLFVDVRDVAEAHVRASRRPPTVLNPHNPHNIHSRYVVSTERRLPGSEVAALVRDEWDRAGQSPPHPITSDDAFTGGAVPIGAKEVDCRQRLQQDLGLVGRDVTDTLTDMIRSIIGQQYPSPPPPQEEEAWNQPNDSSSTT